MQIRSYQDSDWPSLWLLLKSTFETGDTYVYPPDCPEADIHAAWIKAPLTTFVVDGDAGQLLGTYLIKPNQPGLGSHVCNCAYVVEAAAQGQGVATALCEHSQLRAIAMGFSAMQFNLVVSTNERAVQLWRRLGFDIVGTLPKAFSHAKFGPVDAYVMFKTLSA